MNYSQNMQIIKKFVCIKYYINFLLGEINVRLSFTNRLFSVLQSHNVSMPNPYIHETSYYYYYYYYYYILLSFGVWKGSKPQRGMLRIFIFFFPKGLLKIHTSCVKAFQILWSNHKRENPKFHVPSCFWLPPAPCCVAKKVYVALNQSKPRVTCSNS